MSSLKCLPTLTRPTILPTRSPVPSLLLSRPALPASTTLSSSFSVASSSSARLRARSWARAGFLHTTRRSPGNLGDEISARLRLSNRPSCRSPSLTKDSICALRNAEIQLMPPTLLSVSMRAEVSIQLYIGDAGSVLGLVHLQRLRIGVGSVAL